MSNHISKAFVLASLIVFCLTSICFGAEPVTSVPAEEVQVVASQKITLLSGKPITVKFTEDIEPKGVQSGDRVLMVVADDVVESGYVVVRAGAPVFAEISDSVKASYAGQSGRIAVSFKTVKAIDGKDIVVSGSSKREGDDQMIESIGLGLFCCPLFLLMKGDEGVIKSGQTTTIYTMVNQDILVTEKEKK